MTSTMLVRTASTAVVTLDAVVHDPHMHAVFLKYLSEHDPKNFARLLFLVSVDEFKKLAPTDDSSHSPTTQRVNYAKKIIHKYMAEDSFFYIGRAERPLLQDGNQTVASFGQLLHHDLHLCSGLSANPDLFLDVETAILTAMAPSFQAFSATPAFQSLVNMEMLVPPIEEVELQHASSSFTLERVLANRRLCCVFWLFLFKERTHAPLSFWMETTYRVLPLVESNEAATATSSLTHLGRVLQTKYFDHSANAQLHVHGDIQLTVVEGIQAHLAEWSAGNFSNVSSMARLLRQLLRHVKEVLQVNHFVRFIQSPSFHSMLLAPSRNRLCLSPHKTQSRATASVLQGSTRPMSPYSSSSSSSDDGSSDSSGSNSTLQDVVHVMNVHSSHQSPLSIGASFPSGSSSTPVDSIAGVLHFALHPSHKSSFDTDILFDATTSSSATNQSQLPEHLDAFFAPGGTPPMVRSQTQPPSSLFHLTIGPTDRPFYMVCLTRYVAITAPAELNPLELVLLEQKNLHRFVLTGLCVLSYAPNFDTIRGRLRQLHMEALNAPTSNYATSTKWRPSLDQLAELTEPSMAQTEITIQTLFTCLAPPHVLQVVAAILCERKVLLISSHVSVLTTVAETFRLLLRPLEWPHVFAPVLPECMVDCLHCPTPFVFGVHRAGSATALDIVQDSDSTIVVVDLDHDRVDCHFKSSHHRRSRRSSNGKDRPVTSAAPGPDVLPQAAALEDSLRTLLRPHVERSDDIDCPRRDDHTSFPEAAVLALFRETWDHMMDRMEEFSFVLADEGDSMVVFDSIGFLQQNQGAEFAFYQAFLKTQLFSHYIATHALLRD
ncbi:hypothetical protein H310_12232 [Aphanomyces invadans]|uniref:UDENN domain-containing protein n=1 Tax=Aphanomyces invadans TaxID=157072 RepID=A0A024TKQ4_9STRA|nr:hypothetical protein H310_12232 [Aphanomyces invadans]ETV93887.1 hypothetical protein H310_12232 [Aphanomyces invadans]|eukprot:XP_008877447.1 hypothetical protein H310_12232 [Aphanomyces invadans]